VLYSKEINDNAQIQLIILYTLCAADRPVRYDDLINLIFDNCNVNFGEFQIALYHLIEIEHISKTSDKTDCDVFFVLDAGREANKYLEQSIPVYIKNPIKKYIRPYFKEEESRRKVKAEPEQFRNDEYNVNLGIYDDDELPLMEIKIYAGGRDDAVKITKFFKENTEDVYRKVLGVLLDLPEEEQEEE